MLFRSLISLAIIGVLAGCSQQTHAPEQGQAQSAGSDTPATLAHVEAPDGWVVRNTAADIGPVVVEHGEYGNQIIDIPPVQLVSVRGNEIAMSRDNGKDL